MDACFVIPLKPKYLLLSSDFFSFRRLSISAGFCSKKRSMVSRSSSYPCDSKTRRDYQKHEVCQQPAIPQRVFVAVAFSLLLLPLTTNYNASAQTVLTPPITLFQTFPTSNNQLQVATSLDRILIKKSRLGQSTLVSTPTGSVLTAPVERSWFPVSIGRSGGWRGL
jgi:hypothetical protein